MIRTIIVDDELLARENLKLLLSDFCENVEVVGEAGHGFKKMKIPTDFFFFQFSLYLTRFMTN